MQRNETVTGHQTPPVVDGVGNAALVGVALAYILASLVSIGLTTGSTPIPILWLANGVALTALLLGGASAWPGVALGAGIASATILGMSGAVGPGPAAVATMAFTAAVTLEARICHRLLTRHANGAAFGATPLNAFRFVCLVIGTAAFTSLCVGLCLSQLDTVSAFQASQMALFWWLANAAGTLVLVPLVVSFARAHESPRLRDAWTETTAFAVFAGLVLWLLFFPPAGIQNFGGVAALYWIIVPALWAGFRMGLREQALLIAAMSITAITATMQGYGPFAVGTATFYGPVTLQAFILHLAAGTLLLGASMRQTLRYARRLRQLNQDLEGLVADRTSHLQRSEQRLELAVSGTSDGLWDWDLTNDALWCAPRFLELLGRTEPQEAETLHWQDLLPADDAGELLAGFHEAIHGKRDFDFECRLRHSSGYCPWFRIRAKVLNDASGKPSRVAGSIQNITDHKNNEAALRDSAAQYQALFDNAAEAILVFDADSNCYVDCNGKAETLLKLSREDIVGRSPADISCPVQPNGRSSMERVQSNIRLALAGHTPVLDWTIHDSEGHAIDCEVRLVRLPSSTRRLIRSSIIDVTQQHQQNRALTESEARYRTLMEHAPEAIFVVDVVSSLIVDANDNASRLAGVDRGGFSSRTLLDLSPEQQVDGQNSATMLAQHTRDALTGMSPVFEWLFRDAYGNEVPCEVRLARLPASGQQLVRASVTDISNRKDAERALRLSQQRLALHLSQTPLAAITWDTQLRVREWNPAAERIFGVAREDAIGHSATELGIELFNDDCGGLALEHPGDHREVIHKTLEHAAADGSVQMCEWFCSALIDDGGEPLGIASFAQDVTDRERALIALKESEERFRNLIEGSIEGICVHRDWKPLFANQSFARMLGFDTPDELIDNGSLFELVPKYERERLLGYLDARKAGSGAPDCYEFDARRPDGSMVTLQVLVKMVNWQDGPAVLSTAIDVSDRKRAQLELQRNEQYLRQIIDLVPHMIMSRSARGELLLANRAVADAYGEKLKDIIGQRQVDLHPDPIEAGRMLKQDKEVLESGLPQYSRDETFTDRGGSERMLEATRIPFQPTDSDETAVLEVAIDVTARKRAEEELRTHLRELEAVNRITTVGNQVDSLDALLSSGLEVLLDFYRGDAAALYVSNGNGTLRLLACRNAPESLFRELCQHSAETLFDPVVAAQETLLIDEFAQLQPKLAMLTGFSALAALPLAENRGNTGVVLLGRHKPRDFNPREVQGLRTITEQFAAHLQRLRTEDALRASEERYRALYDENPAMFFTVTEEGQILSVNDFAAESLGYAKNQLVGRNLATLYEEGQQSLCIEQLQVLLQDSDQVHRWESCLVHREGTEIWANITARVVNDDGHPTVLLVVEDSTLAKSLSDKLRYHASHDALTGLMNRSEFHKQLHQALASCQRDQSGHALCYLDLDQFKVINDTCGHFAGDELLCQIAGLLKEEIGTQDVVARLGGDEFGVLLKNCSLDSARRVAEALRRSIAGQRFEWSGRSFNLSASIGLVPITDGKLNAAEIMSRADTSCFEAKDDGRDRVRVFREDDLVLANRHGEMQWVAEIHRALDENRFILFFQTIQPLDKSNTEGHHYELLVRMLDEDGNMVPPGLFLPAAERYSLSNRIDAWVVDAAFAWLEQHPEHVAELESCSINLSGLSVGNPQFLEYLVEKCRNSIIPPEKLCFEITETAAISNLGLATRFIRRLRQQGCRFALDDFGSGLSSFAYLKNLPVDYLKIDGVFIRELASDAIDQAAVRSINEIGHVMGKKTIAEFVEDDIVIEKLKEIGVDYAQGFGIAKPQPIDNLLNGSESARRQA